MRPFEAYLHRYMREQRPDMVRELRDKKVISPELSESMKKAMVEAREAYLAERPEAKVA